MSKKYDMNNVPEIKNILNKIRNYSGLTAGEEINLRCFVLSETFELIEIREINELTRTITDYFIMIFEYRLWSLPNSNGNRFGHKNFEVYVFDKSLNPVFLRKGNWRIADLETFGQNSFGDSVKLKLRGNIIDEYGRIIKKISLEKESLEDLDDWSQFMVRKVQDIIFLLRDFDI